MIAVHEGDLALEPSTLTMVAAAALPRRADRVAGTRRAREPAAWEPEVLPGVSVRRMSARDGRDVLYVVVPGNVGGAGTLTRVLDALDVRVPVA